MDRATLEVFLGPWFHVPVGIGLAVGLFWVLGRMQPGAHPLVVASQAALAAAVLLCLPLAATSGRIIPPVTMYLLVVSIVCGIIAFLLLRLQVGIWGLLVPAIAIALLYFLYRVLAALAKIL